jgi:hypothetical protein
MTSHPVEVWHFGLTGIAAAVVVELASVAVAAVVVVVVVEVHWRGSCCFEVGAVPEFRRCRAGVVVKRLSFFVNDVPEK